VETVRREGVNRMKDVTFTATTETAYGKPLPTPIKYSGSYKAFETITEVRNVGEFPSDDEVVTFVNNKRKAAARQKSLTAALEAAGYEKPTLENDPQLQLKTLYKVYIAAGKSDDEARALASSTLGVAWDDGE
jgi:hypothetical protein